MKLFDKHIKNIPISYMFFSFHSILLMELPNDSYVINITLHTIDITQKKQ